MKQNSRLCIEKEDITPRYLFKDKRKANNLVIEVYSTTRMKFLGKKMKLGWNMCNVDDYIRINRCYKCRKFNHRAQGYKGALTCPICAKITPCGNEKPQKRSTNASTSINTTRNHQLI